MRKLHIPEALKTEFATVEAVWASGGQTCRVDALMLSWIKYEKQLRRLFSFFVFQHPDITKDKLDAVVSAFAQNSNLNPATFTIGFRELGIMPLSKLIGDPYSKLWPEIKRIKKHRNKIMHGQLTGQGITSRQIESDVIHMINWISALAQAADDTFGYDGLRRNAFVAAKSSAHISVQDYPFSTPVELKTWLSKLKAEG